jgi:hypothetical protein
MNPGTSTIQKKDIFLNVILPLLLGTGIYQLSVLNGFIRNYLPDGLWAIHWFHVCSSFGAGE